MATSKITLTFNLLKVKYEYLVGKLGQSITFVYQLCHTGQHLFILRCKSTHRIITTTSKRGSTAFDLTEHHVLSRGTWRPPVNPSSTFGYLGLSLPVPVLTWVGFDFRSRYESTPVLLEDRLQCKRAWRHTKAIGVVIVSRFVHTIISPTWLKYQYTKIKTQNFKIRGKNCYETLRVWGIFTFNFIFSITKSIQQFRN